MKFPKQLKIGGHNVKIIRRKIQDENGLASTARNEIEIDNTIPQSQQESTLIHEIFHFLNTTMDGDRMGHAVLDSLSEQIYQVLKDNKLLK